MTGLIGFSKVNADALSESSSDTEQDDVLPGPPAAGATRSTPLMAKVPVPMKRGGTAGSRLPSLDSKPSDGTSILTQLMADLLDAMHRPAASTNGVHSFVNGQPDAKESSRALQFKQAEQLEQQALEAPGSKATVSGLQLFSGPCPGGTRNDFSGEVGIRFRARAALEVTALGRHASLGFLRSDAVVTLWAANSQQALVRIAIGPSTPLHGNYAMKKLAQVVELEAGREYRLTQRCSYGMPDPWFDGLVETQTTASSVIFLGGCYSGCHGYPSAEDGLRRRGGMLNLWFTQLSECEDLTTPASAKSPKTAASQAITKMPTPVSRRKRVMCCC